MRPWRALLVFTSTKSRQKPTEENTRSDVQSHPTLSLLLLIQRGGMGKSTDDEKKQIRDDRNE